MLKFIIFKAPENYVGLLLITFFTIGLKKSTVLLYRDPNKD